jgi:hypothetical protein
VARALLALVAAVLVLVVLVLVDLFCFVALLCEKG